METALGCAGLATIILMLIGFVSPAKVLPSKLKPTRLTVAAIYLGVFMLLAVIMGQVKKPGETQQSGSASGAAAKEKQSSGPPPAAKASEAQQALPADVRYIKSDGGGRLSRSQAVRWDMIEVANPTDRDWSDCGFQIRSGWYTYKYGNSVTIRAQSSQRLPYNYPSGDPAWLTEKGKPLPVERLYGVPMTMDFTCAQGRAPTTKFTP